MADKLSLKDWMTDVGLSKWFVQLETKDAPLPRANLKVALKFFHSNMNTLPPQMALNFMSATDLSKRVREISLTKKDKLIAFRVGNESPFKLFYTRSGASAHSSGINPNGRKIVRFTVRTPCRVLESYSNGTKDFWTVPAPKQKLYSSLRADSTGVIVSGGGIQLLVPNSYNHLEVVV